MRILHWLELWWRTVGGPVRSVNDLAAAMRRRGHEVLVATSDPRDAPREWLEGPKPHMRAVKSGPMGRLSRRGRSEVRSLLQKVDVVHLHGLWERSTNQLAREAERAGVPYILTLRGMLDDAAMSHHPLRKRLFLAAVGGRTLRNAAVVHCTAFGESRQARRWLPTDPVILPNLLDLGRLFALDRREDPVPHLLHLGRIHPTKGLPMLIDVAAALSARGLPVIVDVAGEGERSDLVKIESQVIRHGLRHSVRFHGHVDDVGRASLMQRAWLLVSPTEKENFGNALFEALAAGVPIVTTRGLDAEAELRASGGARLVQRTVEAFTEAVVTLIRNPRERSRLGLSARRWSIANMDPDRVSSRFEALYSSLVDV